MILRDGANLYNGCVFAAIVNAITIPRFPDLAFEHSWDGRNYSVQDGMGSRGTVSFSDIGYVGVFFDEHSKRSPYRKVSSYSVDSFFVGAPDALRNLAENEALQYVIDELNGIDQPVITAVFWSDGNNNIIEYAVTWDDLVTDGGHLIERQLLPIDEAIARWRLDKDMTSTEIALAHSIYASRIGESTGILALDLPTSTTLSRLTGTTENLESIKESLGELNITLY
jgi:hypothetical protein